jgi:oligopeptide/dipeptide ABC transporter ATP-binding protein
MSTPAAPILSVAGLVKRFPVRGGTVQAVRGVSFTVGPGETVGLVGESGCGKSTLGKTVIRLLDPDEGTILLDGADISVLSRRALKPHRRRLQMIFQDPYASLNPRSTAGRIIEEPLIVHDFGTPVARKERVAWLMQRVGLRPEAAGRYPHEFSGGQRQRIGIARALAINPKLIICDEPVSALDVSVQAQVLNLLGEIQEEFGLSYLFISHDLSVVEHFADRILVMYLGHIVEAASREEIWTRPLHPYTRALIGAVPVPDPDAAGKRRKLTVEGEVPSSLNPPSGCSFHPRCPFAIEQCRREVPPLRAVGASGRLVACHLVEGDAGGAVRSPADAAG